MTDLPPDPPAWPPLPPPPPAPPSFPDAAAPDSTARIAQPRRRGNLVGLIAAIVAVTTLLVLGGTYLGVGYALASSRTSAAQRALDSTLQHKVDFSQAITGLSDGFSAFSAAAFDPLTFKTEVDGFVQSASSQRANIEDDDKQLEAASRKLGEAAWLTVPSRGNLDRTASRIGHARKALAAGSTITSGYAQDGRFLEAYAQVLLDVGDLNAAGSADLTAALTVVDQLKTDAESALALTNAPGLPAELHELMADVASVATDFHNAITALIAKNDAAYAAAKTQGDKDLATLGAVDTTRVGDEVKSFYQPYFATYSQELQLAAG